MLTKNECDQPCILSLSVKRGREQPNQSDRRVHYYPPVATKPLCSGGKAGHCHFHDRAWRTAADGLEESARYARQAHDAVQARSGRPHHGPAGGREPPRFSADARR